MQKRVLNALVAGFFLLLAGCQSTTVGTMFSPYPAGMSLAQSVQDALARNEDPVIAQVHVETNQNTVILSGYVKKIRQSDVAEQIAHQVPGVQTVENNIILRR
jgi:osmotically-inducible protein OsmY